MKVNRFIVAIMLCLCVGSSSAQEEKWGMNNPYLDDKLFHMGFQIGMNFGSFGLDKSVAANVSSPGFGFRVAFVGELRLCKYLSLRCTPGLEFNYRTLTYKNLTNQKSDPLTTTVGALPIYIPLYLKFTADRLANFRPYVIGGGGVSFNVSPYEKSPVALNLMDYFCEAGFGCDIYFRWFKLCPELTYRIGFGDQLNRSHTITGQEGYVTELGSSRMINQAICLTFNFQD